MKPMIIKILMDDKYGCDVTPREADDMADRIVDIYEAKDCIVEYLKEILKK